MLASGFVVGGLFTQMARQWLPASNVKEFLTTGVSFSIGPLPLDLVILKFTTPGIAFDFSLMALLGVLVAYLIARSLF